MHGDFRNRQELDRECVGAASTDTLSDAAVGDRLNYVGGVVTGTPTVSVAPGIGDEHCPDPIILGLESGIGTIHVVTAGADVTSGTIQFSIHYIPMSDGAYVTGVF